MKTKTVLVAGFTGSMGQKAVQLINESTDYQLTAVLAPQIPDTSAARTDYHLGEDVQIFNKISELTEIADIWVDFTTPQSVFENTQAALNLGMHPVIGTSGLKDEQISQLQTLAQDKHLGGIIAPNFGLSAVLLMKFAQEAAKYFPDAEIIEMHHEDKQDAPSGTALNTAKLMTKTRNPQAVRPSDSEELLDHVRGGDYQGIKIHSVRLPGYVAHEQVLFGGPGEALTIRQDSFDRGSFMQGVKVALDKVMTLDELIVGLEKII
ncbi:4-hydroxy-tetrahydrodipicolinate reductase [Lactobacillus sp. DCY120]|uniref:4-hydroxy-tetrahydrodipicolinate reductase n=1 Tax=Bombilactobacillus apium TaxID=2675299 RepID=A0A850R9W0_9LACO|nr:4-hydroxy-tetrahydrodipicolinate reductase [Bombilactobacillus apium]NVY95618.1 4-hydroxy-tetrahydrodipicolinate reductase [Bombilactobacillus apium]